MTLDEISREINSVNRELAKIDLTEERVRELRARIDELERERYELICAQPGQRKPTVALQDWRKPNG